MERRRGRDRKESMKLMKLLKKTTEKNMRKRKEILMRRRRRRRLIKESGPLHVQEKYEKIEFGKKTGNGKRRKKDFGKTCKSEVTGKK